MRNSRTVNLSSSSSRSRAFLITRRPIARRPIARAPTATTPKAVAPNASANRLVLVGAVISRAIGKLHQLRLDNRWRGLRAFRRCFFLFAEVLMARWRRPFANLRLRPGQLNRKFAQRASTTQWVAWPLYGPACVWQLQQKWGHFGMPDQMSTLVVAIGISIAASLFILGIRIDDVAGLVLRRIENHLGRKIAEFIYAIALDILKLN